MPHVANVCPDTAMWSVDPDTMQLSQAVPLDECLQCSLTRLDRGCSYDFGYLMQAREGTYTALFSPSRMNGCDRELYFKEFRQYTVDPKDQRYKIRGTRAHSGLEVPDTALVIGEARVFRVLNDEDGQPMRYRGEPLLISVQPDKIYPGMAQIHDDKTWKYLPRAGGKPVEQPVKSENRFQLSVGAWAWANPSRVEYRDHVDESPKPITITSGQIILRDGESELRQWGIPLIPTPTLERWMRLRVKSVLKALNGEEPPFPPPYKRWRCGTCPVRQVCNPPEAFLTRKRKPSAPSAAAPVTPLRPAAKTRSRLSPKSAA